MRNGGTMPDPILMGLASDPPEVSAKAAARAARELFGLEGLLEPKRGERDRNFLVRASGGREVLLKISHPNEDPAVVDLQTRALLHVAARDPDLPVPHVIASKNGNSVERVSLDGWEGLMVRAPTWRGTPRKVV